MHIPFSKNLAQPSGSSLSAIVGLVMISLLFGCERNTLKESKASIYAFGTIVELTLYHHNDIETEDAIAQVNQTFQQMHQEWHAWEKGGIVHKINQAIAKQQPIEVPSSVKEFIEKSQLLSKQSQGLFDPGIGSLVSLWGFHSEQWQGPPPSQQEINKWLENAPSIDNIYFDKLTLNSHNPNVQLDFGGNAKGLAIDIALATLLESGIENALVSIGGDMKVIGSKRGHNWKIGIQSPLNPNQAMAKIELQSGESIVTSGTYQRYYTWQDQSFSHILNPQTGYPANSFSSVTVIHPDATTADAAATALLIAGPENWLKIAESMKITHAICIDQTGQVLQTDQMSKRVELLSASF